MNRTLPPFAPPSRPGQPEPDFKQYWAKQEKWLDNYQKYIFEYMQQMVDLANSGAQGFALTNIPAAAVISIGAYTTIITGTATITKIKTSPDFSGQIHLIAQDGFDTAPGINISKAVTVAAGDSVLLDYNPVTRLWYPNQA
jgi:hypothetical protein